MTEVVFLPSGKSVKVMRGTRLLEAARGAGVEVDAPCGGEGSCGRCIVRVASGDYESDSLGILPGTAVDEGYVLACRTAVHDSPLTVDVAEPAGRLGGKFVEDEDGAWLPEGALLPEPQLSDPLARKVVLKVPEPQREDGLSDLDRFCRALQKEARGQSGGEPRQQGAEGEGVDGSQKRETDGKTVDASLRNGGGAGRIEVPLAVVRTLAGVLREDGGTVAVTLVHSSGCDRVVDVVPGGAGCSEVAADVQPGGRSDGCLGVAIDVGTTTVAVQLISLAEGRVAATRVDYNAQISCGLDVISRIQYARMPARQEELRVRVLSTINNLIRKVARSRSVTPESISAAVVAGNTTMMHLLLGVCPEYIRLEPYTPTLHEASWFTADDIGMHINPLSPVFLCPSVGSYVGGDITAGLLCTGFMHDAEQVSLFMDIGTNGELVMGNRDFLIACACSAGPAFEGGGIEQGMRAAAGAIERVEIDPESGAAKTWTIGGAKPVGICGSGMISLLANLLRSGWIDRAGRLDRSRPSPAIRIEGRRGRFQVVSSGESGTGAAITISEADIENIIRAKAAVYSAIGLLLSHAGIGMDELATITIAGGFGRYLDLEDAITIGLIPDLPRSAFSYVGNASLAGASKVLLSGEHRKRLSDLARRITYIELNTAPNYMDGYTSALFLPHTDMRLFPSAQAGASRQGPQLPPHVPEEKA